MNGNARRFADVHSSLSRTAERLLESLELSNDSLASLEITIIVCDRQAEVIGTAVRVPGAEPPAERAGEIATQHCAANLLMMLEAHPRLLATVGRGVAEYVIQRARASAAARGMN